MGSKSNGKRVPTLAKAASLPERRAALRQVFDLMDKDAKTRSPPALLQPAVRWLYLADEIAVSLHTVQHWVRTGTVPRDKALTLELRYGHLTPKPQAELLSRSI